MGYCTLILSSIATVLLYMCFNFSVIEDSQDFSVTFERFRKETNYQYVSWGSLLFLLLHFSWNYLTDIGKSRRCYSQRISAEEYERQKQTYTQIKINELINSRSYQKYLKSKREVKNINT